MKYIIFASVFLILSCSGMADIKRSEIIVDSNTAIEISYTIESNSDYTFVTIKNSSTQTINSVIYNINNTPTVLLEYIFPNESKILYVISHYECVNVNINIESVTLYKPWE